MTLIMGIVNATPDSFSDGGRHLDPAAATAHGLELVARGASIIDVGGESTRPGAERVDTEVEIQRILPVVAELAARDVYVSIDTMNAQTAAAAIDAGARLVNDVSGGLADAGMLDAVATTGADIALGHWRGQSADMYARADYADVAAEVVSELSERARVAVAAGISPDRIILDPGIGFGKTPSQNWEVLASLDRVVGLGYRVLLGTSRKRFLAEAVARAAGTEVAEVSWPRRDTATAITSAFAARAGVWGLRVHDVDTTRDALAVTAAWEGGSAWTSTT